MKLFLSLFLLLGLSLSAKELTTVFSYSTPPYVFKSGEGIVMSIVKESLAHKGYTIKPVFVTIGRALEMFKHNQVDATSIIKKSSGLDAFYSDYFMQYHNAVFSLSNRHYNITDIDQLTDFNIIAFQNADKYLGKKFFDMTKRSGKKYVELGDQAQQVLLLLKGRTDLVVMDRHIFKYYKNKYIKDGLIPKNTKTDMFELFEPTQLRTAFKSKKIRDDFNEGIKFLRDTGRFDEIYEEFSKAYFEVKK